MAIHLPLEINVMVAKELGLDVLRLRREKTMPIDLSSDLILYNALIQYESHLPQSSIRQPIKELGGYENVSRQELEEREALYWAHQRGCPRKLISTGHMVSGHAIVYDTVRPALRHGCLVFMTTEGESIIIVHDLLRRMTWKIRGHHGRAQVVVTGDKIMIADFSAETHISLFEILMDGARDIDLSHQVASLRFSRSRSENVRMMTACENAVLLLCVDRGKSSLRLWKDGDCRCIAEYDDEPTHYDEYTGTAVAADADSFLFARIDEIEAELAVERYSLDGVTCEKIVIDDDFHEEEVGLNIRYTGSDWRLDLAGCDRRNVHLSEKVLRVNNKKNINWKDIFYEVSGTDIKVKLNLKDQSAWEELGVLRFFDSESAYFVWDILVDDSFMAVLLTTQAQDQILYFVFSFEDLPGQEVGTEPALDKYFWAPDAGAREREQHWTWYD